MIEMQTDIPKLRFPEFKQDLDKHNLGEIANFSKGKGISKAEIAENGATECIRYGELYTTYGETIDEVKSRTNINEADLVISEANDVIIPASGETQIDIATASCVLRAGIALGGDINIIKTKNNGVFLSYYLNSKKKLDIAGLAQGISVVHLYSSQLARLELNLPTIPEQDKIALFLRSIDEKRQSLKKKKSLLEDYKKGVMQKLFSQELRFKDENGKNFPEWESKKIGNCLDYEQPTNYLVTSTEYEDKHSTPVVTAGKTFILGYTDEQFGIYNKGLPVIIFDDFTTASQFVDFPFKAKSSAMKILTAKENTDIKFMYEALQMINYETGAHGRHWISVFAEMEILIPSFDEQIKIASFLSSIDGKIKAVSFGKEQTENWKQGLLQKMFC